MATSEITEEMVAVALTAWHETHLWELLGTAEDLKLRMNRALEVALSVGLQRAEAENEALRIDRDEWRTQHENLLSVKATDTATLLANADRADRMAKINIGVAGKVAEENERLREENRCLLIVNEGLRVKP